MKKNYKYLLIVLLATIGLAACKKDDDTAKNTIATNGLEITAGGKTYLVSKLKLANQDYAIISYDSEARLTNYSFLENGRSGDKSVSYDGNKITIKSVEDETNTVITLGANGYAETAITTELEAFGPYTNITTTTSKFTQNNEGYLIKQEDLTVLTSNNPNYQNNSYTEVIDFIYLNGNLTSKIEKGEYLTITEEYEYYTDKPHISLLFDLKDLGYLLGKCSKNMVKKTIYTVEDGGGQLSKSESTVNYAFNSEGLPITATINNSEPIKIDIEYIVK